MILIGKTANCLLGAYVIAHSAVLKAVDEFVCMREITRSVKGALKCLIAVVLVDDVDFRCKFRHRRSIRRPRFPVRVQNFSDLPTFSVDFLHFICWMWAIFLFRGRLTYWPRKYTTRVDPHVDNSHQVWSWYDHKLPSDSVFACWYVTWPCDLDLWPFDLEHMSYMANRVTNIAQVWRPYAYPFVSYEL